MTMTPVEPLELLREWLRRQLPGDAADWLESQVVASRAATDRSLFVAISLVHRRIGKADLDLSAKDAAAAETAREGWRPTGWSLDQAARVFLLLAVGGTPDHSPRGSNNCLPQRM